MTLPPQGIAGAVPAPASVIDEITSSPWGLENFVEADLEPSMTVDEQAVAVLADVLDVRHRLGDEGVVLEGGVPMQEAAAGAARLTLRERGIPGHRSAWWTVPAKVAAELAVHLDRHDSKPHHLGWDAWLAEVITQRRLALLVISEVQRVLTGKGSRSVHRTWHWLIRQHPQMTLILIGDHLLPRLLAGAAQDELRPYVRTISWRSLTGEWGSNYFRPPSSSP
ncbi:hypothetical protein ACIBG8_14650 [Nonomuraea sp. NPDC050556]|uniref:hypothetical protein n=1 Tax=Nonomuraea sp. NPDC050556 TaxID=3364369 RepID=UPI0037923F3D